MTSKLPTDPYKGVRDFYPRDERVISYIRETWAKTVQQFGYEQYNASPLEPSELYEAKTSEEIVNNQTFTFEDRGGRRVTLRPEMTPTLARMVAHDHDLPSLLRWYSIPNVFRYEKPQRGRLREHYQLNVDLIGASSPWAEVEILSVISAIFENFGANQGMYTIKVSDRTLLGELYTSLSIDTEHHQNLTRLLDKLEKMSPESALASLSELVGEEKAEKLLKILQSGSSVITHLGENHPKIKELRTFIDALYDRGVENVLFTPSLARGFDYYTGFVFEVFDTSNENNRSLFGGGRYDGLLEHFGRENIPFVGFGCGDVAMIDFLETHNLMKDLPSTTLLSLCVLSEKELPFAEKLAADLRAEGITVDMNISMKKLEKQIKRADKLSIPFIICVGEKEAKDGVFELKHLPTGTTWNTKAQGLPEIMNEHLKRTE